MTSHGHESRLPSPAALTPEAAGLSIDMLDVDRLRQWAGNIETYGGDLTHWGSTGFIVKMLRDLADRLAAAVRDIGTLRQSPSPARVEATEGAPDDPGECPDIVTASREQRLTVDLIYAWVNHLYVGTSGLVRECVNFLVAEVRADEAEVTRLTQALDNSRALVKDICAEWHEACDEACDAWGHTGTCRATSIAAAKRALQAERDQQARALGTLREALEDASLTLKACISACVEKRTMGIQHRPCLVCRIDATLAATAPPLSEEG